MKDISKKAFIRNVLSNYASVVFLGGGVLVLYPIYIKVLGAEQWGIVSACLLIQSFMLFLDSGMSQIMPRDVSSSDETTKIYSSYLSFYLFISIIGFLGIFISSHYLSSFWFNGVKDKLELEIALKIISIQFFFQFLNNANLGLWNGLQAQVIANKRVCIFFFIKHALAFSFILIEGSAVSYVLAFSIVTVCEFFYNFSTIKRRYIIKNDFFVSYKSALRVLFGNLPFSIGVIIGVFTSQLDRILISKYVSIELFGYYSLAVQYGLAFLQFQYPIIKALIPAASSAKNKNELYKVVRLSALILTFMFIPLGVSYSYSKELLVFITKNNDFVEHVNDVFRLIIMSVFFNYIYGVLYSLMIKNKNGFFVFIVNICAISAMLIYFFIFSDRNSLITGGVLWNINVIVCLSLSSVLFIRARLIKCG